MEWFSRFSLLFILPVGASFPAPTGSPPQLPLNEAIHAAALRMDLDPKLVQAVVKVESNFRPNATSPKGAMGLMQVMPNTTEECGILDAYHAVDNLMGACQCLRMLLNRFKGDLKLALAAYNAGVSSVEKYGGIPPYPETITYVEKVLNEYRKK